MGVKVRDDMFGYELGISAVFLIIALIGMVICFVGLGELPKCKYGELDCYFFVKVCGESYFNLNENPYTCTWVSKARSIEGTSVDDSEQLTLPMVSAGFALIPGLALVISTIIRNERCLLGLLESGKAFLMFDTVLLIVSCVVINRLTFDCRWYSEWKHGNTDKCESGYIKYIAGTCVILVTHVVLLLGIIAFGEIERKRVRGDGMDDFNPGDVGDLQSVGNAVPMNIRVQTNQQPSLS